jgi:hypothetical protein
MPIPQPVDLTRTQQSALKAGVREKLRISLGERQ